MLPLNNTKPILIEKIKDWDIDKIIDWFDTRKDVFYKTAFVYLNDIQFIEDIFYKAIMKIDEEKRQFKIELNLENWFLSFLLKECWGKSNQQEADLDVLDDNLLSKLSQLEQKYKDTLLLKYLWNLTNEEISEILEIEVDTVKSRLFSGVLLLLDEERSRDVECRGYEEHFIDYVNMILNRETKIKLEMHIHTCDRCNNLLYSFQQVFFNLSKELENWTIPSSFTENVMKRVKETVKEREQLKRKVKKKRCIVSSIFVAIMVITLFIGIVTNRFSYLYYSWLEWNESENEEMLNVLKSGLAEPLNLVSESNGIKITIKTAIADDYQTVLYYEVENSNKEDTRYTINMYEGVTVENQSEVMKLEGEQIAFAPSEELTPEKKGANVFNGKINLLPINSDSGTIKLKVSRLLEVIDDPNLKETSIIYSYHNNQSAIGEWSFEIPVTKQPSMEHKIDKEFDVEGVPVIIDKVVLAPTTTILEYRFIDRLESQKQIQDINIDRLESGDKVANTLNYFSNYMNGNYSKSFETLYFEKIEELNLHFSSMQYSINDPVSFDLDVNRDFPQTFDYLGKPITVENIKIGNITTVDIKDAPPEGREYDGLQFNIGTANENEPLNASYNFTDTVLVDRNGTVYAPHEYQYYGNKELPRNIETKYQVDLFIEGSDEVIIPTKLNIHGYRATKYLDEVVKIKLN